MEVRSEGVHVRCDKLPSPVIARTRLQVWFIRLCSSLFLWTCLVQLVAVGELWHPHLLSNITNRISQISQIPVQVVPSPPPLLPASKVFFFLVVGGVTCIEHGFLKFLRTWLDGNRVLDYVMPA